MWSRGKWQSMAPCCGASLGIGVACGEQENIPLKGTATMQLFFFATVEQRQPNVARFPVCPTEFYSKIFRFFKRQFKLFKTKYHEVQTKWGQFSR